MRNMPELRFSGFKDAWEEKELNQIIEISKQKFNPKNSIHKICIELEHISSETGKLLGFVDSINQESIKNIFKKNQIIYGKLRPYLRKFWFAKFNGVCSSEFWVINGKNVENKYLYFLIQTEKFHQIANVSFGSKMPRADWSYLSLSNFFISPDLLEQQKIASFLSAIDKKIELTDKKLEYLESYKKGLMQKLLTGEIRFPGFNDEWKQEKLGNILKERQEYTSKNNNSQHLSLTINGILLKTERYNRDFLVKNSNKKYKITYKNDICYNPANLKFGVICKNNFGKGIFSPIYVTFEVNKNFNKNFIGYFIRTKKFIKQALKYQEGTIYERMSVNPEDLLSIKIKLPSPPEQQKIASFLSAIDKKIELTKSRLENLKTYKKGLLQKMFV